SPLDHERLAVLEHGRAAGRVAVVADGEAAAEPRQDLLAEDLRHVAHAAVADEGLPVRGHDARRLLPPVLEGVEAQVRERRRLRMAEDADHAALLVELVEHPPAAFTLADAAASILLGQPPSLPAAARAPVASARGSPRAAGRSRRRSPGS